ncbi:hypothetical protein I4641_17875 [Waterburya agarophytonicola K14]|uniref:Uncharacterized protein n=1 Tax=Waterburya agarophytonicola KI4 TaxID=2874699 RepID=A0A964FGG1_9CYAN|nr:hypothetical protein [Waterburya agarophytonicola]MCC0178840.1 hypothetical protein [Waterburya agarophytonicola KI4]
MNNAFNNLKAISSITVASFSLLAMPFVTISAEASEEKSQFGSQLAINQTHIIDTEIDMTDDDSVYINNMREHYHLD